MERASRIASCVAVVAWPAWAAADRAVGRTDRLDGGTVEVGVGMERSGRATTLEREFGPEEIESTQVALVPRLRVWLADWLDLELRQPFSWVRTPGSEDIGWLDTELRTSTLFGHGPLVWGGGAAVVYPSADEGFGTERTTLTGMLIGGWRVPHGVVHIAPAYTLREGDSYDDAGDVMSLEVGYQHRIGALSLVPTASVERTLTKEVNGVMIEDAFTTWRIGGTVARELSNDLTATLSAHGAWAREHDIAGDERVGARELLITMHFTYAWDLWTPRAQAVRARDPAAIHVAALRIDGHPATAPQLDEIRHLVPQLRLATLTAEHEAGGATGAFRVLSTGGAAPGSPWNVAVHDDLGQPRLTAAIADFFRDSFPAWARTARTVELHLCFDDCSPGGR